MAVVLDPVVTRIEVANRMDLLEQDAFNVGEPLNKCCQVPAKYLATNDVALHIEICLEELILVLRSSEVFL